MFGKLEKFNKIWLWWATASKDDEFDKENWAKNNALIN